MSITCEPRSVCPGCGRTFTCGMGKGLERCWCADLPSLGLPPAAGKGCYCPECLKSMLAAKLVKPA